MATKKRKPNVVDTTAELKAQMKKNGVRLPHGYDVVKRKPAKKKASTTKKKTTSRKGVTALKKINAMAKTIQKQNPEMSWNWCVKSASKKYNQTK